jgi:hypothetical protein
MPGDVLVERDASLSIARCLPVQQWEIAQILAIVRDQVEGVGDRGSSRLPIRQLLEP